MTLISCAMVFTSCKDAVDNPIDETKEVTLAVTGNGGEVITVSGTDVVKDVIIKATENVDRDIEVTLTTDAVDGNAVLSAPKATIAKGSNSATVTITFPSSKFPEGTNEKAIKVSVVTNADKVVLSPSFTTFNVKGQGGIEAPAVLTAVAEALQINTTDAAGIAVINFTLSKAVDEDITVVTGYETPTVDVEGIVWDPAAIVIAKNTTTLKVKVTVPQGRVGTLPINFSCENSKVNVETKKITINFVDTPVSAKPSASISTPSTTVNVVDADITNVISVTLSTAVDKDVVVNLAVTSSNELIGTLSAEKVTFTAGGALSQDVNITFAAADFGNDKNAKVTVTATSTDVDVKPSASAIIFNVTGPVTPSDKQDGLLYYEFSRDDDEEQTAITGAITFTDAEKEQGYITILVYSEATNPPYDEAGFDPILSFDYTVSGGLNRDDIVLITEEGDPFSLVYNGVKSYGYSYFKLMKSAIGKTGKLVFTSPGVTFAPDQGWDITVN